MNFIFDGLLVHFYRGIWSSFGMLVPKIKGLRKSKDYVAIKIVRGVQKYREAAMVEIDAFHIVVFTSII